MIRTAILAAMLLVMLSMAYSRTGQLPDLRVAQQPAAVEPEVAAVSAPTAPPSPRVKITERPGIDPASPMTPIRPTIAKTTRAVAPPEPAAELAEPEAPLAPASVPQAETVAAVQAAPVAPQPAPAVVAAPVPAEPVVAKTTPTLPEPVLSKVEEVPVEQAVRDVTPLDEMPVKQVATPRVMMPRDLPLPSEAPVARMAPRAMAAANLMDDGFPAPPPGSNVNSVPTSAPQEPVAKKPAESPQFMSREERTRELYRLAHEMEDTFISKLAR